MGAETNDTAEISILKEVGPAGPKVVDYVSAFENSAVGIGHINMTGHWEYANGALARILGYSASELKGLSSLDMTHPDDAQLDADRILKLITGEVEHYAVDKRFRRSDGAYIWTRKTLVVRRRKDGYPEYLIAVIEDIDQRKKTEAQNAFLIQELAHRSRNLLSVISSLTSLLAPTCHSVPEFEERLLERLHAISRSNDYLLGQYNEGASLNALVRSQISAFVGSHMEQVTFDGVDIPINAKCSETLVLALYELTSNALKYGALSASGGHIHVAWKIIGAGNEARFRFSWSERSPHLLDEPGAPGFGSRILGSLAPMSVRGSVTREFSSEGMSWTLEAPLSAVIAQVSA
ncbi:MAG: PAS domain S-box protein [Hyphomonas oceanitis]|uniref:sensor histidine kinase n=1 Tax=Hyphomonas oceanitis TaxID=81033 RepID=UPI0030014072